MNEKEDRPIFSSQSFLIVSIILVIIAILAIVLAWAGKINGVSLTDSVWQFMGVFLSIISLIISSFQVTADRQRVLKRKKLKKLKKK